MTENREIAEEILSDGRMLLCMDLRFMTRAVMSAEHVLLDGSGPYSCDGRRLYYHADNLISDFRKNPNLVPRTIAHMILHLVLGHTSPDGDSYTDLAEDMVTEYALDMINTPNISLPDRDDRIFVFEKYLKKISAPVPGLLSGELKKVSEWQIRNYPPLFSRDSHSGRKGDCDPEWNELASQMLVEIEGFSRNLEGKTDALLRVLRIRTRKKHDFRRFLRKFMISRERAAENPDEFDPAYYTFGLARYGNIPLIDSTENSDSPSIEEFVIAIDTSGSTMRGPAFGFVNDVYTILEQCGVSGRTELHIVQCDNLVRTDDIIRCRSDLEGFAGSMVLSGGGGTDFRPVFQYVSSLRAEGKLSRLKGLIYFTDGIGIYPESRPDYPVAFIFCDEGYLERKDVPAWAVKVSIGTGDLLDR